MAKITGGWRCVQRQQQETDEQREQKSEAVQDRSQQDTSEYRENKNYRLTENAVD